MPSRRDYADTYADERKRQREFHMSRATSYHSGRRALLFGILVLSLFFAIGALAIRQATSPAAARNVLGAGIARVTDLDRLLAEDLPSASDASGTAVLPGFPIDIQLTQADVAGKTTAEVRQLVLDRAAALVYDHGVHAFDRTGNQAVSRFSAEGLLTTQANQITRTTHSRATTATVILAVVAAVAAVSLISVAADGRRLRLLAIAVFTVGLAGLAISGVAWALLGQIGGSDPFDAAMRSLARSVVDVPLRDFLIVSLLGVAMLLAMPVGRLLARPFPAERTAVETPVDQWAPTLAPRFESGSFEDDDAEYDDYAEYDDDDDEYLDDDGDLPEFDHVIGEAYADDEGSTVRS